MLKDILCKAAANFTIQNFTHSSSRTKSFTRLQVTDYLSTMNSQLPNSFSHPINYLGTTSGLMQQPPVPLFQSTGQIGYNIRSGAIPPQLLQHQATLDKILALGFLQHHQFVHNFAFNNSERYHPRTFHLTRTPDLICSKVQRSASTCDLRENINEELLKHIQSSNRGSSLGARGGSVESVASHVSSELDPDRQSPTLSTGDEAEPDLKQPEVEEDEHPEEESSTMHPRGIKRHPDHGSRSPIQKRPRSEERDFRRRPGPWSDRLEGGLTGIQMQNISDVLWKFYEDRQQPQDLYVKKMKLRDALYAVMKGVFPYCGLYVVGSSMNGFGAHSSDMDLCLMLCYSEIDQKKEATEILRVLFKALRKCTFLKELKLIRAKVPILKFRDRISGVECDLNINNAVGIRNTHLLSSYSKLDMRVNPLVLFVKHWAKAHNINDASQSSLSSYSLVHMVLHYLQCGTNPPLIPSLQQKYPHKFSANLDIRLLTLSEKLPPYTSPNKQLLGELFVGFLNYYANVFNCEEDAMSIRLGKRMPRETVMRQNPNPYQNPPSQWKCICIEEPFNLSNTARSVFDPVVFQRVLAVIRKSHGRLRQTGDVRSILDEPL